MEQNHESDPQVRVLSETLAQLNLVTTDLQLAVMKTRMLPIKKVFAKLPRMVRDLSQKLNKQVHLEMRGEETELDKSVADEVGDPLVHLVRNAIDHGIETPAERQAKGKPGEGQLTIAASQEGNSIVIRINDDGRGIQVEKIKAKALAKGLISEAELAAMEHREILNLIFLPARTRRAGRMEICPSCTSSSTLSPIPACSNSGLGMRIPCELPMRTIRVCIATVIAFLLNRCNYIIITSMTGVKPSGRDISSTQ